VEFHVEVKGVFCQLSPQVVGGCPRDVFAKVGDSNRNDLLNQGDADECNCGPGQHLQRCASQRGVNKLAHDLRGEDSQADTAEQ